MERNQVKHSETDAQVPLSEVVQAHLGRASWFADGRTRNWTLFFFFRILNQAEIDKDVDRLTALIGAGANDKKKPLLELIGSMEDPALMNAGLVAQAAPTEMIEKKRAEERKRQADSEAHGDNETTADTEALAAAPAQLFLEWLKLLTDKESSKLGAMLKNMFLKAGIPASGSR